MRAQTGVIILIIFGLNLFLYLGGVAIGQDPGLIDNNKEFLRNFVDINQSRDSIEGPSDEFENVKPESPEGESNVIVSGVVGVAGAVTDFTIFVINIIYTPFGLFIGTNLPGFVQFALAVPLAISALVVSVYFIRGIA